VLNINVVAVADFVLSYYTIELFYIFVEF